MTTEQQPLDPAERAYLVTESRALLDRLLASPAAADRERAAELLEALRRLAALARQEEGS
jgi:hypothetical protein